jgi:hypothetical protein
MTSRVSWMLLIPTLGASRIPARAASDEPSAHDSCWMRAGDAPVMAVRSGSSTTPRIAIPMRVREKSTLSPTATVMATTTMST